MTNPTINLDDVFGGIGNAKASMDPSYCAPGKYLARIGEAKIDKTRGGDVFFAMEMDIVEVIENQYEQRTGVDGSGQPIMVTKTGHRVGDPVSHFIPNYGGGKDLFLPNIKAMLNGVLAFRGISLDGMSDAEQITFVKTVVGSDQPLKGLVVEWHGNLREKKKSTDAAPDYFTRITYQRTVLDAELEEKGIEVVNSAVAVEA